MLPGQRSLVFLRERSTVPLLATIPVLVIAAAAQNSLLEAKHLARTYF